MAAKRAVEALAWVCLGLATLVSMANLGSSTIQWLGGEEGDVMTYDGSAWGPAGLGGGGAGAGAEVTTEWVDSPAGAAAGVSLISTNIGAITLPHDTSTDTHVDWIGAWDRALTPTEIAALSSASAVTYEALP